MLSTTEESQTQGISTSKDPCEKFKVAWCQQGTQNTIGIYDKTINKKYQFNGAQDRDGN